MVTELLGRAAAPGVAEGEQHERDERERQEEEEAPVLEVHGNLRSTKARKNASITTSAAAGNRKNG